MWGVDAKQMGHALITPTSLSTSTKRRGQQHIYYVSHSMPQMVPFFQEHLPDDPNIIFLDNLRCQRMEEYIAKIHENNGSIGFGPENFTHAWAPIDRGHIGATLKKLAEASFDDWLEQDSVAFPGMKIGYNGSKTK